eukprot:TRINITY_DN35819_c0_g1_i1.p1 TRINITY_DN35819_c0_g1~~TRINITY_DN35819_c0_g1_i1.p1  ORF type:complete len:554 (+),score=85.75 TRINITY_DN35819_c0_g1_i1:554-2215(+)
MGAKGSKSGQLASDGVVVALPTGQVQVYLHNVTVGEVMEDFPGYFVSATCLINNVAGACAIAIPRTTALQMKKVYFLYSAETTNQQRQLWDERQGELLGRMRCDGFLAAQAANSPQTSESPQHPVSPLSVQVALDKWLTFKEEASEREPDAVQKRLFEQGAYQKAGLLGLRERLEALTDIQVPVKGKRGFLGSSSDDIYDELLFQSPVLLESALASPGRDEVAVGEWLPLFPSAHALSRESSVFSEPSPCSSPESSPFLWGCPSDGRSDAASNGPSPVFYGEHFAGHFDGRFERSPILYGSAIIAGRAAGCADEASGELGSAGGGLEGSGGGEENAREVQNRDANVEEAGVQDRREERYAGGRTTAGISADMAARKGQESPDRTAVAFTKSDDAQLSCLNSTEVSEHGATDGEHLQRLLPKAAPMAAEEERFEEAEDDNWLSNSAAYAQAAGTPSPVQRRKGLSKRGRGGADMACPLRPAGRKWRPSLDAVAETCSGVRREGGEDEREGVGAHPLTGRAASRFKGKRWSLEYLEEKKKERIELEAKRSAECVF